jgi:enamine deaminase RidA (YjgF/YER057c/UK114 family)
MTPHNLVDEKKHLATIKFKSYTEYHLTIRYSFFDENSFKRCLNDLEKRGLRILRIVVFGKIEKMERVLRNADSYPHIFLGHSDNSKKAAENCGMEIVAVKGKFEIFEYVKDRRKIVGTYFKVSGREHLYVSGLGLNRVSKKIGFGEEVRKVYELADSIFSRYNFSTQNVYRFWNCMENILTNNAENYALFNRERDAYFKKHGVSDYPAATGIESALSGRQRINLSLEAVKAGKDVSIQTLHSDFQCEAWEYKKHRAWGYGPKFSRGKILEFKKEGVRKVYISGTSNVDQKGQAVFLDDMGKNMNYVVSCAEHLLEKADLSLDNIISSRLYFKSPDLFSLFKKISRKRKWNFIYNLLFADICRNNFFFEMECMAAKKFSVDRKYRKYGAKN